MTNSTFVCNRCEPKCILTIPDLSTSLPDACPFCEADSKWEVCEQPPNNTVEHEQAKVCEVYEHCGFVDKPDCCHLCGYDPPVG